jgi:cobalt-zinc-cadmium efflux system outer membrane protein
MVPFVNIRLAALALCLAAIPAAAQRPALSLQDALTLASARGPLRTAGLARRALVRGAARVDAQYPNPTFEWRRENDGTPLLPDVFATIAVPIDLTGRRLGLSSSIRAADRRAAAESLAVTRDAGYAVAKAWWRAALTTALADLSTDQSTALAGIARFDSTRFAQGAVPEVAALRTRLEASRARVTAAQAAADAARARNELARLVGVPEDSLGHVASPVLDRVPTLVLPPEDSVVAAVERRPDVLATRYALEQAERRASAESRGILGGDIQLVGGAKRTAGFDGAVLSAIVPLPLFNRNGGARERSYGELLAARLDARDVAVRAVAEARAARQAVRDLLAAIPDGGAAIARAGADVATITDAAYREGAASLLELLEAQRARADAIATALRWRHDLAVAQLELDRALGRPVSDLTP